MKKKYINYLLFALVLSLCIFYFYNEYDGFQASPVDFTNFSGQLTGIRVYGLRDDINPLAILKTMLGNNLTDDDISRILENKNGDLVFPYYYINSTGNNGTGNNGTDDTYDANNPYNVMVMPEIGLLAAQYSQNQQLPTPKNPLLVTFNFSRNPKITPINLTNLNIQQVFNNIYANLYKSGIVIVSLILNNNTEYPKVDYSKYSNPVPVITPKIRMTPSLSVSGFTVRISLLELISKIGQKVNNVSEIKPDGSEQPVNLSSGTMPDMDVVKVYKLLSLKSNEHPNGLPIMEYLNNMTNQNATFLLNNPLQIPDSVIQNFFAIRFIEQKLMYEKYLGVNIIAFNLENPTQEIKVDISEDSSAKNTASYILDQIRKLVSI